MLGLTRVPHSASVMSSTRRTEIPAKEMRKSRSALRCRPLRAQPRRKDTRAGSYERSLHTVAGEVNLKVPKLRRQTFETAIIERYRRRESSVEEALIEM